MIIDRYIMSVHSLKLLRPLNRQWQSVTLPTYIQLRHASSSGRQETSQYPHIFYSSMTPPLQVETISPVSIKVHRGALRAPLEMGPSEKEPSGAQELWHFGRMGTHGDLTWADLRDICIHLLVLHRCSVFFSMALGCFQGLFLQSFRLVQIWSAPWPGPKSAHPKDLKGPVPLSMFSCPKPMTRKMLTM